MLFKICTSAVIMGLWIQLAFEVSLLLLPSFVKQTSSGLKLEWTPAGGKDSLEQIRWAVSQILDSFSSVVAWMLEKTGFASGDGRRERRPSQLVPQAAPFLGWLSSNLLPPQAFLWGLQYHPQARWGPSPTHKRASVGSSFFMWAGSLREPNQRLQALVCCQLQTKPQARSFDRTTVTCGVYWKLQVLVLFSKTRLQFVNGTGSRTCL